MENISKNQIVYWNKKVKDTELERFQRIIEKKYNTKFNSYWELHKWTVQNYIQFWEESWNFCDVICSKPYVEVLVKTGPGFLDNEWFSGARLNYAENILRIRDNRIALICLDELGNEDNVTFAEMFDEVKRYAAAFRKNGLKIEDRVSCFMSNRKEAIFAFLAAASVGAIWGGPIPYYGAEAASNIISLVEPKFLITIDCHQDNGINFPMLDYLPEIVDKTPTLEKVILIATNEETRKKDLSNIRSCVFLEDFLSEGLTEDGNVPDIVFEQLPFDHPLCFNCTSGTTGLPKTAVHSAGTLISLMREFALVDNLKSGDVVAANCPVGWTLWDNLIPCLGMGITLFLYCGSNLYTINGMNFWDILGKYKVNVVNLPTTILDIMEKSDILPSPGVDLSCIQEVTIIGNPAKIQNFDYILKVQKDVFIANLYAATELFGALSCTNRNMVVYGGELQVPALGIDLHCFDDKGNSVIGEIGEVVICTPSVCFPICLWKDENKSRLTDIYLLKFPGVWTQRDLCWINPETKGLVVIGRSDDTLKQGADRFGASDVYAAIHSLDELHDYICVSQYKDNGDCRAVLFVKMQKGHTLTPNVRAKIENKIKDEMWECCVPEVIVEVPDIPYNMNNKRMERLVQKIVESNTITERMSIRNPESLKHFVNIPEVVNYNQQDTKSQQGLTPA